MKKLSLVLLAPVLMNIVTFVRTFLYDPVIMFAVSFVLFFISLYADLSKEQGRKWRMITAADFIVTGGLMACALFNAERMIHILLMFILAVACSLMIFGFARKQSAKI
ncbi:MAG: hypothetical protein ILP22_05950 [Oscillospiraceae bacterium]|nr:hypothetical protein [Oscillospiraceae bacterium]